MRDSSRLFSRGGSSRWVSGRLVAKVLRAFSLALVVVLLGGCEPVRPDLGSWKTVWADARDSVPELASFEGAAGKEACSRFLARVRGMRALLLPSPSSELDGPVAAWIALAGQVGFECHAQRDQSGGTAEELARLAVLEAEVEGGLRTLED